MNDFLNRWKDAAMPYQSWKLFPDHAIVQIKNAYGDTRIVQVKDVWWGYENDLGMVSEGVIIEAKRLDTEK